MKKFAFIPMAAIVAFGACDETSFLTAPGELSIGVSSPGTGVTAEFTIGSEDPVWQNYPNAPINVPAGHSNTSCDAEGRYTRTAGASTQTSEPHNERCGEFVGGEPQTIVLSGVVANFVAPPSGNRQLNFTVCGYVEQLDVVTNELEWVESCDADAYIHYKKSSNETYGYGAVLGVDEDENEWLVILSTVGHTGRAQFDVREFTGVTAVRRDGSASTTSAVLTF